MSEDIERELLEVYPVNITTAKNFLSKTKHRVDYRINVEQSFSFAVGVYAYDALCGCLFAVKDRDENGVVLISAAYGLYPSVLMVMLERAEAIARAMGYKQMKSFRLNFGEREYPGIRIDSKGYLRKDLV